MNSKYSLLITHLYTVIDDLLHRCNVVCKQTFKCINDNFAPLLEGCLSNREQWLHAAEKQKRLGEDGESEEDEDQVAGWRGSAEFDLANGNTVSGDRPPTVKVMRDNNGIPAPAAGNKLTSTTDKMTEAAACLCQGDNKRRRMSAPVNKTGLGLVAVPSRKMSVDLSARLRNGRGLSAEASTVLAEVWGIDPRHVMNVSHEEIVNSSLTSPCHAIDECDGEAELVEAGEGPESHEKERLLATTSSDPQSSSTDSGTDDTNGDVR